jgi:hypothetical protein
MSVVSRQHRSERDRRTLERGVVQVEIDDVARAPSGDCQYE